MYTCIYERSCANCTRIILHIYRDLYQLTIVQVELNCAKLSLSLSLPLLIHTYGVTLSDFLWKAISSSCMQMCVCACWGCVWYTSTYGVCVCVVCEMCVWYTSTYGVCVCCVCKSIIISLTLHRRDQINVNPSMYAHHLANSSYLSSSFPPPNFSSVSPPQSAQALKSLLLKNNGRSFAGQGGGVEPLSGSMFTKSQVPNKTWFIVHPDWRQEPGPGRDM